MTPGLRKECAIHDEGLINVSVDSIRSKHPTLADYLARFFQRAEGVQFQKAVAQIPAGARVLDIGVGSGETSLYLASQGYRVAVVEPSDGFCRLLEQAALLYGLTIDVYCTTAEHLDGLPLRDLDACIFNASLHHCDAPALALRHCRTLLKPGGQLLLLNEPLLHFFRSKTWFQKKIERGDLVGDYGGNEHTYYYQEYRAMLRDAGFAKIADRLSERYAQPGSYLAYLRQENISAPQRWLRALYYRTIQAICRAGWLGRPLLALGKRLSLLQTNFIATR